ncbi:MAG: hypothetical protein FJ387_13375 [Verrucomicrobia bacterium]|nr:hypothetical protein [Verrucomicrobiota bacterium]
MRPRGKWRKRQRNQPTVEWQWGRVAERYWGLALAILALAVVLYLLAILLGLDPFPPGERYWIQPYASAAKELRKAGIRPRGRMAHELADGRTTEYDFGLAEIEFMGELTSGGVIFGPDDAEPVLGVTALESVGILVDPANRTRKRMPAIPLK